MKTKHYILIVGFVLCGIGLAIRSSFLIVNYVNKPVGGALITIGAVMVSLSIIMIFNKPNSNGDDK